YLPYILSMFYRREMLESAYSTRSFENARKARDDLFGDQNNRKRYDGYLAGLLDPQIWSALQARERKLRDAIGRDPKFKPTQSSYDRIKRAQAEIAKNAPVYNYLEQERPVQLVIVDRGLSPGIFLSMRGCCSAQWTNAQNQTGNGSRLSVIVRANHWSSNFFPPNRSTTTTKSFDSLIL